MEKNLLDLIKESFNLSELQDMVYELQIEYEDLPVMSLSRADKIRALIQHCQRDGRLPQLIARCQELRPERTWPDPANLNSDASLIGEPEKRHRFEPKTVFIPAGSFIMGSDTNDAVESPQHVVDLPMFRIGMYPVTNQEYAQFIWETGRVVGPSLLWNGNTPPDNELEHPAAGVTWYEALAYSEWLSELSGRQYALPTEAQWEKATRGNNGYIFPWGNEWDPERCNDDLDTIASVKAYPAQNEVGCFDMVGNAREWTATIWGVESRILDRKFAYPWQDDRRNELSEPSTTRRIFRGGKAKEPIDFRCSTRGSYLPKKSGPKRNRHGFRVALLPTN